jgi:hypothetical protein
MVFEMNWLNVKTNDGLRFGQKKCEGYLIFYEK